MLFKDIDVPKETWFWIETEEEDKKDEEDKEGECTSSDLSVSAATELIIQLRIKYSLQQYVCMYIYMYKGCMYMCFPHCSKGPLCNPRAVTSSIYMTKHRTLNH